MTFARPNRQQHGAASLLIALVLMMVTTLITLAVARTQVMESRLTGNDNWHSRLRLIAEAEWEAATPLLIDAPSTLSWVNMGENGRIASRTVTDAHTDGVETTTTFREYGNTGRMVDIQAVTGMKNGNGLTGRARQMLLLLSVLSPQGEAAAPLVINGCLDTGHSSISIRPANSDTDDAGDALWRVSGRRCRLPNGIDLHAGRVIDRPLRDRLWPTLFSVTPEEFEQLAGRDRIQPVNQRRYWQAVAADLSSGRWTRSLGSPDRPVVLVFPRSTGCPRFAGGVRIVGFVFIDAACPDPINDAALEITGTLAINGDTTTGGSIRFNHITVADAAQRRLPLPALRSAKIPGTWKDF